ncbi:MAG: HAD family phosphatase [Candidatus Micrarchaeota archaeon]|nr:HAD family phosphatase [Candidatus Micrarchaeota archaeon]
MLRAVLLDMDGVISNTEPLHESIDRKMILRHGRRIGAEWAHIKGLKELDVYAWAIANYGLRGVTPQEMLDEKVRQFERRKGEIRIFRGAAKAVSLIHRKFKVALVSSSPRKIVGLVVEKAGIANELDCVLSGDDVSNGKPSPEPFLRAARALGVPPCECVVVEDSLNGIEAARRAGMRCIAVSTSFSTTTLRTKSPDMIIKGISGLPNALAKLQTAVP